MARMDVVALGLVGALVVLPALKLYERDALRQQRETVRQARLELALRDDLGTAVAAPVNGH